MGGAASAARLTSRCVELELAAHDAHPEPMAWLSSSRNMHSRLNGSIRKRRSFTSGSVGMEGTFLWDKTEKKKKIKKSSCCRIFIVRKCIWRLNRSNNKKYFDRLLVTSQWVVSVLEIQPQKIPKKNISKKIILFFFTYFSEYLKNKTLIEIDTQTHQQYLHTFLDWLMSPLTKLPDCVTGRETSTHSLILFFLVFLFPQIEQESFALPSVDVSERNSRLSLFAFTADLVWQHQFRRKAHCDRRWRVLTVDVNTLMVFDKLLTGGSAANVVIWLKRSCANH